MCQPQDKSIERFTSAVVRPFSCRHPWSLDTPPYCTHPTCDPSCDSQGGAALSGIVPHPANRPAGALHIQTCVACGRPLSKISTSLVPPGSNVSKLDVSFHRRRQHPHHDRVFPSLSLPLCPVLLPTASQTRRPALSICRSAWA